VPVIGLKRRLVPDSQWVQMYRQGLSTPKIAAGNVWPRQRYVISRLPLPSWSLHEGRTPRCHPRLPMDHLRGAVESGRRPRPLRDRGPLPTTSGSSARERASGVRLHRRRQEAANGAAYFVLTKSEPVRHPRCYDGRATSRCDGGSTPRGSGLARREPASLALQYLPAND
jgi:hypothetical protein